jgi:hypothetical protein
VYYVILERDGRPAKPLADWGPYETEDKACIAAKQVLVGMPDLIIGFDALVVRNETITRHRFPVGKDAPDA